MSSASLSRLSLSSSSPTIASLCHVLPPSRSFSTLLSSSIPIAFNMSIPLSSSIYSPSLLSSSPSLSSPPSLSPSPYLPSLFPRHKTYEPKIVVILTKDVPSLGVVGERVEVRRGYARNYLIPMSFAVYDTLEQRVLKGIEDFTFIHQAKKQVTEQLKQQEEKALAEATSPSSPSTSSSPSSPSSSSPSLSPSSSSSSVSSYPSVHTLFSDIDVRKYFERERLRLSRSLLRFQRYSVYDPAATPQQAENHKMTLRHPITKQVIAKYLMEEYHFFTMDPSHITLPKGREVIEKFGKYAIRIDLHERLPGTNAQIIPLDPIEKTLFIERKPIIVAGKLVMDGLTFTDHGTKEASQNIMAFAAGVSGQEAIVGAGRVGMAIAPNPDVKVKITRDLARRRGVINYRKVLEKKKEMEKLKLQEGGAAQGEGEAATAQTETK